MNCSKSELFSRYMLHNDSDMSSLTTPTRTRGLSIRGLDTKPFSNRISTALSYGGLHTPPQSAHDSRRSSLECSTLSEGPYSAVSSSFTHSQVSTPIRNFHQGHENIIHNWSEPLSAHGEILMDMDDHCGANRINSHSLGAPFHHQAVCDPSVIERTPSHLHSAPSGNDRSFGLHGGSHQPTTNGWANVQDNTHAFVPETACLGPALFPAPHTLNSEGAFSIPLSSTSPIRDSYPAYTSSALRDFHSYSSSHGMMLQNPQVVVPSQLSPPEACFQPQFGQYPDNDDSTDEFSNSFHSSASSFEGFDLIDAQSPMEVQFDRAEDDYLFVKLDHGLSTGQSPPSRRNKSSARRLRSAGKRQPWHRHIAGGNIEVRCEGKPFVLDKPVKYEIASSKKPHKCETCSARFDRSEHLKRHEKKHTNERNYPCPVLNCGKKIQRPDNAGDHFKTHLRPKKKGKRNEHVEWESLAKAIYDTYDDKKVARKLLDNLNKWVLAGGMLEDEDQKHLH